MRTFSHVAFWIAAVVGVYLSHTKHELYVCYKGLPILILILMTGAGIRAGDHGRLRWAVLCGLSFSVVADLVIMRSFTGGLVYFLIAHVWYIYGILSVCRAGSRNGKIAAFAPAAVYFVIMAVLLMPRVGSDMRAPVLVYSAVITTMLGLATIRAFVAEKSSSATAFFVGALLFVISDSVIALSRWVFTDMTTASLIIMSTYYAGQYFIAQGAGSAPAQDRGVGAG